MSATDIHTDVNTTNAGVPPAPPEAHQRADGTTNRGVTVRVFVGAEAAYACIGAPGGRSLDVRLNGGRGAVKDMRLIAKDIREKAQRELARAELIEHAADVLERDPGRAVYRAT